jgi:hypothetical protein
VCGMFFVRGQMRCGVGAVRTKTKVKTSSKRKLSEVLKKQVAARQKWTCSMCSIILPSAYEIDHTIPLWQDGADDPNNMTALCATCHGQKSQSESLLRATLTKEARVARRVQYEATIHREEEEKRAHVTHVSGTVKCLECMSRYYPVFTHICPIVSARVDARIGRRQTPQAKTKDISDLFSQFYFT